jgi:phage shock protein PspC (stress-responsive transcriptional regulator)
MNKTVTINISGIIFHIEEDAYEILSKYITTIKSYFSHTEGGNEIMSDIEARIAELLQQKINVTKQVILLNDVEYVMTTMGKPEDFGAEQMGSNQSSSDTKAEQQGSFNTEKTKRRLFRNPDEKAIGGVCSGLAAYFDIDTVWVRLAMFLLIFFGGISLWVYIVLWIVIPLAKTTADKFAMRGESANINNIFKSFKEEAEDVKSRMSKYRNEFKNNDYNESVRTNISRALHVFFNVVGRLLGLFLIVIGAILLFAYVASLFGISIVNSNTDIAKWKSAIFESPSDYALAIFAFIIVIGVPVFMLIYGGIKLLFKIHYSNRWLNLSMSILWTVGITIGFYVAVITVKQFGESSRIKNITELHGLGDTLVIKLNPALAIIKPINFDNEDDLDTYLTSNNGGYCFGEANKKLSVVGYANLNVVENNSDSVELIINKIAKGNSKKEANENAKAVTYNYKQNRNELIFDEIFVSEPGLKFRAQELDIKIKLPIGKVIYFDKSVKHLLNDIDNTTNTWDGDMISRRWKMTEKGLKCLDCDNLDNLDEDDDEKDDDKSEQIIINGDGIKVNGNEIEINKNGIKINTPGNKIEVKNNDNDKK